MRKAAIALPAVLFFLGAAGAAQVQGTPRTVNFRYTAQVSNGPAGSCGCFGLQGFAADAGWRFNDRPIGRSAGLGVAADFGVVHTGSEGHASYGLTLTTLIAGPRLNLPGHKFEPFVQALFGFAHGSGSAFPQGSALIDSASSFALDLGAGADWTLRRRLSVRVLQLDYLRTALPNTSTDWQNNLRIGVGLTLRLEDSGRH
jgi:opacity protein-like surface antigen